MIARGQMVGKAKGVRGHLECRGLIFGEGGVQVAIPELEAYVPDLEMTHEAAVGKIAQDQVEYDPRANSSAGQLITWVFIPLLGISSLFAYERQQGTLRRMISAPVSKPVALLGNILGQFVTAFVQMAILATVGAAVGAAVRWRGRRWCSCRRRAGRCRRWR